MAEKEKKAIEPITVKSVQVTKQLDVPPGKSLVVPIINGQEDENQAFIIGTKTAERVYSDTSKFVIKKKN